MTRSIYQFYTRKETGEIVPNAEVRVFFAGAGEAPIYDAENGGNLIVQPLIATASAKAVFYVDPGIYDIQSKDPILLTTATFSDEEIGTSRESLIDDNQHAKPYSDVNRNPTINDLSIVKVHTNVLAWEADTDEYPDGKSVHLLDRGANFTKITGVITGNDKDIIASTSVDQSIVLSDEDSPVSIESLGFVSGDASSFLLVAAGKYNRVTTISSTFSTSSTVDMLGTEIQGISGKLTITGSGVKNCLLVGAFKKTKPDFVSIKSPAVPVASQDIKMLIRRFDQAAYIMQSNNQGYIRTVIQDGIFTAIDSAGAPAELIRSTRVDAFHEVWVGHGVADVVNGVAPTIETFNGGVYQRLSSAGQTATSSFDKGAGLSKYFITTNGHYVEYQNLEVINGIITLMIQTSGSTTFTTGFTVDIDGSPIDLSGLITNSPSGDAGLLIYKIPVEFSEAAASNNRTLRVTHTGGTGVDKVNILGCNIYRLNELVKPLYNTNWFAAFALDVEYVSNNGASDYAIFDTDDVQWIGSVHGGETRSSYRTEIDGADFDYNLAAFEDVIMGSQIRIQQSTDINGKMQTYQYIDFSHFGGYSLQVSMTGDVNCSDFFTCMSTSDPRFEFLEYPKSQSTSIDGEYDVGNNDNVVVQYAPVAADGFDRRKIRNSFTFYNSGDTDYNGAYVQRSGALYNKLYYGPVFDGQSNIKNIAFMVIKEFY